jgi:hypothetical protein
MQGTFRVEAEQLVHSAAPSSVSDIFVDLSNEGCKVGSPRFPLVTPKVEGEEKKQKSEIDQQIRKVKPVFIGEADLPFTPPATLPFSPKTEVNCKPYSLIKLPSTGAGAISPNPNLPSKLKKKL